MKLIDYCLNNKAAILAFLGALHVAYIHGSSFVGGQVSSFIQWMQSQGGWYGIKAKLLGAKPATEPAPQPKQTP